MVITLRAQAAGCRGCVTSGDPRTILEDGVVAGVGGVVRRHVVQRATRRETDPALQASLLHPSFTSNGHTMEGLKRRGPGKGGLGL
jgi:hypothetical protein